ncbi:MAG: amidohydrolase family protein, partial [Spirochaetales bacterium]|nr:amidohydrolase family protein [Spirochaetales bacterium]
MKKKRSSFFLWCSVPWFILAALALAGCVSTPEEKAADMVLKNGHVYTMDANGTKAEALAVTDGIIVFVGSNADAEAYVGPGTEVWDLKGMMVLPGMIETHLHPPGTADADLFSISLFDVMSDLDAMLETIQSFVEEHPDLDMYFGSGFSTGAFTGMEVSLGPKKERLDAISPDKPIFLVSYDGHIGWINSAGLDYLGITKDTPDPAGGRIERDPATGEPWGAMKEAAAGLMPVQELSLEQQIEAMELFQERMHGWGYTGIQNMSGRENLEALAALESEGKLKLRVRSAVSLDPEADLEEEFALLEESRDKYTSPLNTVGVAKFFADG